MSDLVGNPEDRFSRVEAHLSNGFKVSGSVFYLLERFILVI